MIAGRGQPLDQVGTVAERVGLGIEGVPANQRAIGECLRVAASVGQGNIDIVMPFVLQQVRMKRNA
ncbi:hypothetical protein D3C75_919210 [compost metagenome]